MASEEYLKLLKRGVGIWNRWRQKYVGIRPDLQGTNLISVKPIKAYLRGVDFSETDLCREDFSQAKLSGAILNEPELKWDTPSLNEIDYLEAEKARIEAEFTNFANPLYLHTKESGRVDFSHLSI